MTPDAAPADAGSASPEVDGEPDQADATPDEADAPPEGGIAMPIDPEVSRRWTWQPCGQILPAVKDAEAVFGADGTAVVRGEDGTTRSYDATGAPRSGTDQAVGSLIVSPDGTPAAAVVTPTSVVIRPLGAATARFSFALPASIGCGHTYAFSKAGDYFLAHGGGPSCVWRADDGEFVASFPDDAAQAAIRGRELVTLQVRPDGLVDLVTRDFSGQETTRLKLDTKLGYPGNALLSPAGDRVASMVPSTLWDVDGHALLVVAQTDSDPRAVTPAFTAAGDLVLLANGVFRTADGTRTATLAPLSPLYEGHPLALSRDGSRAIASTFGRASLFDVSAPGFKAVLGPGLRRNATDPIQTLAISATSMLVAASGGGAFGIQVAPRFEDSSTIWAIRAADITFIGEISADGRWATAAGDNRALFSATDGRIAWPSPAPVGVRCFGSRLAVSPRGTWAAGASYAGTMDVFSLADTTRAPWSPVATLPTECLGAATFSRDERMLGTSAPALYRVDAVGTAWTPVWSHFAGSSGSGLGTNDVWSDARFSPDESLLLVSRCDAETSLKCNATLYDTATGDVVRTLPALTEPRPSFSPDGSWVVAGPTLLHLPSHDTRPIDPSLATHAAVFTPDGDIVAAVTDGALVRYCRSP